jgi:hypothetical protein
MRVELSIDQHGLSPLSLRCLFPDTGEATIPADVIDGLIGAGVTGFPFGRLVRMTADSVQTEVGCVELRVGSPVAADVSVAGYVPCDDETDCPIDLDCNLQLQRCE